MLKQLWNSWKKDLFYSYLAGDKLFNGIVITDIDLVQIDGVVDVVPHVVVILHMVVKALYSGCTMQTQALIH